MKLNELQSKIGYEFKNKNLLKLALTHSSYKNEGDRSFGDNERLEFLGDAVLSLIVARWLYDKFEDKDAGVLSKTRASLVYNKSLTEFAESINLGDYLFMGRGEEQNGGRKRPSNLENAYEALVGAIYLDGGIESAHRFVERFLTSLKTINSDLMHDYKSKLIEKVQSMSRLKINYSLIKEDGPPHDKTFFIEVSIGDKSFGWAKGKSKKKAEQSAAEMALNRLDEGENFD